MKGCDDYLFDYSLMLDGELPEPQKTELMRHLASCAECAEKCAAMDEASHFLETDITPPAGFADGVMAAIKDGNVIPAPVAEARSPRRRWRAVAALAACLAVVLIGVSAIPRFASGGADSAAAEVEAITMPESAIEERSADTAEDTDGANGSAGSANESNTLDGSAADTDTAVDAPTEMEEDSAVANDSGLLGDGYSDTNGGLGLTLLSSPLPSDSCDGVTAATVSMDGELLLSLGDGEADQLAELLLYSEPYTGEELDESAYSVLLDGENGEVDITVYVTAEGLVCESGDETFAAVGSAEDFLDTITPDQ